MEYEGKYLEKYLNTLRKYLNTVIKYLNTSWKIIQIQCINTVNLFKYSIQIQCI